MRAWRVEKSPIFSLVNSMFTVHSLLESYCILVHSPILQLLLATLSKPHTLQKPIPWALSRGGMGYERVDCT